MKNRLKALFLATLLSSAASVVAAQDAPVNSATPVQPIPVETAAPVSIGAPTPAPMAAPATSGDEFRKNPFLPELSGEEKEEERRAEERRREIQNMIPQIRQDLYPEVRDMIRRELEASRQDAPQALSGTLEATAEGVASGLAAPLAGADGQPVQPGQPIPLDAAAAALAAAPIDKGTLVACMNGRPIYKNAGGYANPDVEDDACKDM